MSNLGFSSGSTSGRKTRVTASSLYRGPPNPQLDRFYDNAVRMRNEAIAAQQLQAGGMPAPVQTQQQQPMLQQQTYQQQPQKPAMPTVRPPVMGGRPGMPGMPTGMRQPAMPATMQRPANNGPTIDDRIEEARQMAQTAITQISSINNVSDERLKNMELQVVGLQNTLSELKERLDIMHNVAEDAWYNTFWMTADVLSPVSLTDGPLPNGNIVGQLTPGERVLLVGRMQDTPVGVCMRTRRVNQDTAEISEAWVLLRDTENKAYLGNFTCQ